MGDLLPHSCVEFAEGKIERISRTRRISEIANLSLEDVTLLFRFYPNPKGTPAMRDGELTKSENFMCPHKSDN